MKNRALLLTCEHAGARVPGEYRHLFRSKAAQNALRTHRGSDLGALGLARQLSLTLDAPLYASSVTRLLVDLNRSVGHPRLLSEFSKPLSGAQREVLLQRYYFPHRDSVESWIAQRVKAGSAVLHIGVHSFTPEIDGRPRTADVGLLYDPARSTERSLCERWTSELKARDQTLRVRRNYPFLGKNDGLVTHLRRRFAAASYVGIELEVNQSLLETRQGKRRAATSIAGSLARLTAR
jgi:predicted N-formylglutamate amidohydrolase